jgi:hypothetical protein
MIDREIAIVVSAILGGVRYLGTDRAGNLFVLVEELQGAFPISVEQVVRKYTPDGRLVGTAHVPLERRYAIARRNVDLAEDGQVYCMVAERDRVRVLRLPVAAASALAMPGALRVAVPAADPGRAEAADLALRSALTREQCINIAQSYYMYSRYCSLSNYSTCGSSVRPAYMTGYDRYYQEVPYSYSGFDSTSGFGSRVGSGSTAGNVGDVDLSGCCAGIDCSGYVSRCWALTDHYGTCSLQQLPTVARVADKTTDLQSGDILNKQPCYPNGHVRLFNSYWPGGCYTYEASAANGGRVWYRSYAWSDFSGYDGFRYNGFT